MSFENLLILIPTRNRSDFAINAIRSILGQNLSCVRVIVSDNSTDEDAIARLKEFCCNFSDQLTYIRPPDPLPMTNHWDWAMNQAMELPHISHIAYFSDRYVFIANILIDLIEILKRHPDKVVSYTTNSVDDSTLPIILNEITWSGRVFEIDTILAIRQYAKTEPFHSMPRMINCAVPVSVIENIEMKFGNYFSSVAPDFNFLCRIVDTTETYLYYDRPLFVNYGMDHSSGRNILRGTFQKDATDFINNLKTMVVNFPTPVDEYRVLPNALMVEYYDVKRSGSSGKFPDMDMDKYFTELTYRIFSYENPEMRRRMIEDLVSGIGRFKTFEYRVRAVLRNKWRGFQVRIHNLMHPREPYILQTAFDSVDQALIFASDHPRKSVANLRFAIERTGISVPKK